MQFQFDEKRATQAAAFVLRLAKGKQNYTWLVKLLYLADRESLTETGAPIAGANFWNLHNGPLAGDVLNCAKHDGVHSFWDSHIEQDKTDKYCVRLTGRDAGDSELSDLDTEILSKLYDRYKSCSYSRMIDIVHELSEWEDPGEGKRFTLPPEQILRGAGVDNETIAEFERVNQHLQHVDRLLG
jgi:uncharacterized phage-associated protein